MTFGFLFEMLSALLSVRLAPTRLTFNVETECSEHRSFVALFFERIYFELILFVSIA